jgi:hypothetical protein
MSIEIVLPQGAFGASDNDTLLDTVLRCIAEACPHHESSWVEKYGTDYENDVFKMMPFCWCDQDDCPWCAGCTCEDTGAYRYFVDEQEVTAEEYYKFRYDANLPYGEPNFKEELEKLEQHCRVEHIPENACPYCKGELFLEQGAEPGRGAPNFWYKPTGFKVWWYKYIGRGVETNGVAADLLEILRSCLASLEEAEDG